MGLFSPIQSLLGLANSWASNQTFSGTANTAPNQTAASGSSLITRDLMFSAQNYFAYNASNVTTTATNTYTNVTGGVVLPQGTYRVQTLCYISSQDNTSGNGSKFFITNTNTLTCLGGELVSNLNNTPSQFADAIQSNLPARQQFATTTAVYFFNNIVIVGASGTTLQPQFQSFTTNSVQATAFAGAYILATRIS